MVKNTAQMVTFFVFFTKCNSLYTNSLQTYLSLLDMDWNRVFFMENERIYINKKRPESGLLIHICDVLFFWYSEFGKTLFPTLYISLLSTFKNI